MLEILKKLFGEQLGLTGELWVIALIGVVFAAFLIPLIIGLAAGKFKQSKSAMRMAIATPTAVVAAMKKMPEAVKAQYKNARVSNLKPSMLVTEKICVTDPYKQSLLSKAWLTTFVATVICALLASFVIRVAVVPKDIKTEAALALEASIYTAPSFLLVLGGLLTFIAAVVGACAHNGAAKIYKKFVHAVDGDQHNAAAHDDEPQQAYSEPQQPYAEPQQVYAEPQQVYAEPQADEPQQVYAEPQQVYAEPQPVVVEQQESDEEIRRRAREEALAQARAQQQAAQSQQQANTARPAQQASGSSTVDQVIAQIEKIDRDGAPRETMREVAQLLQKERQKPENKTPECQKRLNDALSKLLKAMSAAGKK